LKLTHCSANINLVTDSDDDSNENVNGYFTDDDNNIAP